MSELRDSGEVTGGPAPFSKKDAEEFANQLKKFLQKMNKLKNIMNNNKALR